jgi:sodium-independent sulfate anion transporter 11
LTTAEVVHDLSADGEYTPVQISSAVAMCIGLYGIIVGFLNLGFLLEFISLPILSGFISAVAITIGLGQVPSLLGEDGGSDSTAGKIHDMFSQLPDANGYACGIGFGGLVFLTILDKAGKRWGDKYKVVWLLSITRAFLCLVLFTGISYAVNGKYGKDDDSYLFEVVKVAGKGIIPPKMPPSSLISKAFPRSIAAFIGPILEHIAIARAFGVKNNYVSDQTQELCYFGITNFVNSFFHVMGVGGAMSRTSVNSACKVKSPLSGIVTTAVLLVCIFKLTDVLYWIPKATLAAIIITAVWPLINPPSVFYKFWKTSLADFISAMLAFWVCLFVSTEAGLGAAVGFNIVYVLLRQTFTSVKSISSGDHKELSELRQSLDSSRGMPANIPDDLRIFRFHESFFFPNAYGVKTTILNNIKTHHSPAYSSRNGAEAERIWSVQGERQVARLRKKMKITDPDSLPPANVIVFDLTKCNHLDSTACTQLKQLVAELRLYCGKQVELRFTGASDYVRTRMWRAGFELVDDVDATREDQEKGVPQHFASLTQAISAPRRDGDQLWKETLETMNEKKGDTVERIEHIEEKV